MAGWLMLSMLGIIWIACLVPSGNRRASHVSSVEDFGRTMQVLADTERRPGRWVLVPQKDERFLGERARAYVRARDLRRRVFTLLVEATGLSAVIGLAPPLRAVWLATLVLVVGLVGYCLWLVKLKEEYETELHRGPKQAVPVYEEPEILENEIAIKPREEAPVARPAMPPVGRTAPSGGVVMPVPAAPMLQPKPEFGYPSIPPDVKSVRVITLEEALELETARAGAR